MRILLILLFSTISLSLGQQSPNPVRDIDGNLVRSSAKYYILPVFRGRGGGLTLAATRNESCPLDVVQENMEVIKGLPLAFIPSNVWMLDRYEGELIVTGNGKSGNPGPQTISNWFKIEKFDKDYKLVFCPTVCNFCKVVCGDIGVCPYVSMCLYIVLSGWNESHENGPTSSVLGAPPGFACYNGPTSSVLGAPPGFVSPAPYPFYMGNNGTGGQVLVGSQQQVEPALGGPVPQLVSNTMGGSFVNSSQQGGPHAMGGQQQVTNGLTGSFNVAGQQQGQLLGHETLLPSAQTTSSQKDIHYYTWQSPGTYMANVEDLMKMNAFTL
ncbi:kunitz family trypsin and protease inhibitor protein [Artemisia annua]|uniref:Kunitz family trypsin and protease inhibitor protein n=1 Tax=Artemisia annua TaxID=35608 RepID=A0A2U1PRK6_ARTAN|nr:kunitz family trypsin and protease inhibitor protein [Artemisia annua]